MITVIGFIRPEWLSSVAQKRPIVVQKLPVGWSVDGNLIRADWHESLLILVDDGGFKGMNIRTDGAPTAFRVQHNGSGPKTWRVQERWLSEQGWNSIRIDRFSHEGGYAFWTDVLDLLAAQAAAARQTVLNRMATRYQAADTFKKLDTCAAWATLSALSPADAVVAKAYRDSLKVLGPMGVWVKDDPLATLRNADAKLFELSSR